MQPGATIGEWTVLRELGRGGMGSVFEARHEGTGERVAIKVLTGTVDEVALQRFAREAHAGAVVEHANVLRVLGVGRDGGRPFLVMELATGGSLEQRLKAGGRLPWADVARIGAGLARGLAALHEAGFVHRDLKPANILFDASGAPRLADFGLVRPLAGETALTASNLVVGTPAYLSPEQADGKPVTPASDVYGLGCALHEALTGSPPFKGKSFDVLRRHLQEPAPDVRASVPGVPADLARVVRRCLAKPPAERPGARELGRDLEALAEPGAARRRLRPPTLLVALAAAGAAALGGRAVLSRHGGLEPPSPVASTSATVAPPKVRRPPAQPTAARRLTHLATFGSTAWTVAGPARRLAVDNEGKFLVAAGMELCARLFDLRTGAEIGRGHGTLVPPTAVAISPDGAHAAIAGEEAIDVVSLPRDLPRLRIPLEGRRCLALLVEKDAVIAAYEDGTSERASFSAPPRPPDRRQGRAGTWAVAAAIARDSGNIVFVAADGTIHSAHSSGEPLPLSGDHPKVDLVALSDDASYAAFRRTDDARRPYVLNMVEVSEAPTSRLAGEISALAFAPASRRILCATQRDGIAMIHAVSGVVTSVAADPDEPRNNDALVAVAPTKRGEAIVGFTSGGFHACDPATGKRRSNRSALGGAVSVAVSRDGRTLGVGSQDGRVTLCPTEGDRAEAGPQHATSIRIRQLALDQDGRGFAVRGEGGFAGVFAPDYVVSHWGTDFRSVAMDATGRRLTVDMLGHVGLWGGPGRQMRELAAQEAKSAAFRPDGSEALAWVGGRLRRWSLGPKVEAYADLPLEDAAAFASVPEPFVFWSPDALRVGARAVEGKRDATLTVWNTETGGKVGSVTASVRHLMGHALRPGSDQLAVAGGEGTVELLDYRRGVPLDSVSIRDTAHDQPQGVAFSPDGARLYVGTARGQVLVYAVGN